MKRCFGIITVIALFVSLLSGCTLLKDTALCYDETVQVDGLWIEINRVGNCCFAGQYDCAQIKEDMVITIPDSYDGIPLTKLGGYVGTGAQSPFMVNFDYFVNDKSAMNFSVISDSDAECYEKWLEEWVDAEEEYTVEDVKITLNIGKNITGLDYVVMNDSCPCINEDGSITVYHPVFYVMCSEENKYFYSKDGKLYERSTDRLITDFYYE